MAKSKPGIAKLSEAQRLQLLEWIGEGLNSAEINELALKFEEPFEVSRQLVYQYRQTYDEPLKVIRQRKENEALTTGLALKAKRLEKLYKLAAVMEEDLHEKKLRWLKDTKMVGNEKVTFEQFNAAEIRELRGVYDDIAKETGGRMNKVDITSGGQPLKTYVGVSPDDWDDRGKK